MGIRHRSAWEMIALVSDHHFMITVRFFSHLMPCEVSILKNADIELVTKWIVSDSPENAEHQHGLKMHPIK